ncbi:MAG: 2-hydroxyhepta-2,4-diene-1,7-dioate isomerase, partial [Burkholderiaceae bacterium]
MKLLRFGKPGKEKPGMLDHDGKLRDLSGVIADVGPEQISPKGLAKLAKLKLEKLPLVRGKPRLGVPFTGATKFVAIGLNYSDHAAETGNPIPKVPIIFHKTLSSMQGPNDDVM